MTICIDGPEFEDFDPTESVNRWLLAGPGTRHLEGHKYPQPKPQSSSSQANDSDFIEVQ